MNTFTEIPANKRSYWNRSKIFGIGINDADYMIENRVNNKRIICPYYKVWKAMFERCYDVKCHAKHPTYKECTIDEEWFLFSNFKNWMKTQNWENMCLDKDIMIEGNKIYSPNTCIFISHEVNNLFLHTNSVNKKYLLGVTWDRSKQKFVAQCNISGKVKKLGIFDLEIDAHLCYLTFKKQHIINIANNQKNFRVKERLLYIAETKY